MLKEPKHGWSQITIGNWSDRCSYLDDVPFLLLEGMEGVCRTGNPVVAKFDAEGWEYLIVFDVYEDAVYGLHTKDAGRNCRSQHQGAVAVYRTCLKK